MPAPSTAVRRECRSGLPGALRDPDFRIAGSDEFRAVPVNALDADDDAAVLRGDAEWFDVRHHTDNSAIIPKLH